MQQQQQQKDIQRQRTIPLYVNRDELENIVDALASHESAIMRKMSTPRRDVFDIDKYHKTNALLNRVHAVLTKMVRDDKGSKRKAVKRSFTPPQMDTKTYRQQRSKNLFSMWK